MPSLLTPLTCAALISVGAGMWAFQAVGMRERGELSFKPNPLGLKRSAYGEVIAMALQGPIDEEWRSGVVGRKLYKGEQQADNPPPPPTTQLAPGAGLGTRLTAFLKEMQAVRELRTNPRSATEAHKLTIRRNIEDRLRFAYEFDPSNFGNYNSYHFFITQPQLGTRPVLSQQVLTLAEQTIRYCESRKDDPRPALTAAAAAENILQLMFERPEKFGRELPKMRLLLGIMDRNLARYRSISTRWDQDGTWQRLSTMRRHEAEERYQLTLRLRHAAATTIARFEQQPDTPPSANSN